MARTNQDGKSIKLVLEWLCHRHLPDTELAAALDIPPTNYYRRRDADEYPTYEELDRFANYFNLSARALQIAFGLRDQDELAWLDEEELRQYVEQGGGKNPLSPTLRRTTATTTRRPSNTATRRRIRIDAPPGG